MRKHLEDNFRRALTSGERVKEAFDELFEPETSFYSNLSEVRRSSNVASIEGVYTAEFLGGKQLKVSYEIPTGGSGQTNVDFKIRNAATGIVRLFSFSIFASDWRSVFVTELLTNPPSRRFGADFLDTHYYQESRTEGKLLAKHGQWVKFGSDGITEFKRDKYVRFLSSYMSRKRSGSTAVIENYDDSLHEYLSPSVVKFVTWKEGAHG